MLNLNRTTPSEQTKKALSVKKPATPAAKASPKSSLKSGNATRDKVRADFLSVLSMESTVDQTTAVEVALAIENEMFRLYGPANSYKAKFRQLHFNLKSAGNSQLRCRVAQGHVSAAKLCQMTSEELAAPEVKTELDQLKAQSLKEAIDPTNVKSSTDQFKCKKCGKRECSFLELQTRSADEPMTCFVECHNCGNRWKQ
eukprot:c8651_g1_i1.p1 GENE.c8651_g1_i1~~c8651_g1_i1.p1  ORF type:complete len:199 (+),score=33.99 c8651_g1_i1:48-644(+)